MTWPDTPCDNCPVGNDCKAMRLKVRRYCDLVNPNHPDYKPAYIAQLKGNSVITTASVMDKVRNFGQSVIQDVFAGMPRVPDEIQRKRLSICESNVCGYYDALNKKCKACGCFLEVKTKWALEKCPLKPPLWDAEPVPQKSGGYGC